MLFRGTVVIFCFALASAVVASVVLLLRDKNREVVLKRKPLHRQDDENVPISLNFDKNYPFMFDKRGKLQKRPVLKVVDPAAGEPVEEAESPQNAPVEVETVTVGEKVM
ncbi:putative transmembrane protein [Toxoplasma gondii TgCatPRC2]|uniref:Transmembrane protein n=9 Tax=Toxoplasma gondii TaxID=5811 RepID=S7V2P6_TOXGG|nr:hypothetical protein TGGT1_231990 [Toxoplasma gondii GT1]KAF4641795.1 hypothetical protein TGRH88_076060 [Toxoplasma gondii]KFG48632.1 putative transmembrane protein [Toxoplasma gondii GAB2-2007-GAL-DOM2]KFG55342.1 putative transmembrane protein [Toxoplasma gondii FOU]KFG63739.1 putative transmembrane protein [Toxoplasma gondii RUB]KFH11197.1 putative transmembrane protein [Toxoplasma gondii VAND]KYK63739.1 putative transmembrane protein [Toxoplasma gondii TgCatPRC2]PUA92694.1 putative tr